MKRHLLLAGIIGTAMGWFACVLARHDSGSPAQGGTSRVLFYQSPMHPWVKSATPGKCTVCGMDLVPIYEGGRPFDAPAPGIVMLPAGSPNVVGVQVTEVTKKRLIRTLHVAGTMGEDETRHGVICAPVEGRLDALAMSCEGQRITQRQPFATCFSRTLLAAAEEYKQALVPGGAALDQARQRLERYGLVWEQIKAIPLRQPDDMHFGLLSPTTGTIVKSYVAEGQYVKEGDKIFETADFLTMWLLCTVYEQDLPLVQVGQVVTLQMPSLPGESIKAKVTFVSPMLDKATRSAQVRVEIENPQGRIKNNALAEGSIEIDLPETLAVPRSAVLWSGGEPRVYVEKQVGAYEPRKVKLGRAGDTDWELLEGLAEGERVVTRGNMLLDGQERISSLSGPS